MTREDHTTRLVLWAIALFAAPLVGWLVVDSWPSVYAYLRDNPFALLFICGGMALAFVSWLIWWQSRPAPSDLLARPDHFCARWDKEGDR